MADLKAMSSPMTSAVDQPLAPSRRAFLRGVGGAFATAAVLPSIGSTQQLTRYSIGLSDRAMGMRGSVAVFETARTIGASGVEIDFGRLGTRPAMLTRLTTAEGRQLVTDASSAHQQTIYAVAFNAWRDQSFADHPQAVAYTLDAIRGTAALGAKVLTLPVAHAEDLAIAEIRDRCVENLKQVAPAAEAAGVVIALDVALPPADMKRLLDAVGSSAVAAAVPATSVASVAEAFTVLGGHRLAQIRFSIDETTTQAQQLAALREVCNAASWAGWVVIDRLATSPDDLQAVGTRAVAALSGALTADYS